MAHSRILHSRLIEHWWTSTSVPILCSNLLVLVSSCTWGSSVIQIVHVVFSRTIYHFYDPSANEETDIVDFGFVLGWNRIEDE